MNHIFIVLGTVQMDGQRFVITFNIFHEPPRYWITANGHGVLLDIYSGGNWLNPHLRNYWNLFHITPEVKQLIYDPVVRLMLMVVLDWDGDIPESSVENLQEVLRRAGYVYRRI